MNCLYTVHKKNYDRSVECVCSLINIHFGNNTNSWCLWQKKTRPIQKRPRELIDKKKYGKLRVLNIGTVQRRHDENRWSQMQGGQNWTLPKEINADRFFWNSHWLDSWKNQYKCPSMGPNGRSAASTSGAKTVFCRAALWNRNRNFLTCGTGTRYKIMYLISFI